ncbi:hypothetical protein ES689_06520 [Frigoribacterium sp. ACAM 257]|nr:hypothetical protein ES689_06520 [Frigoribacterium sp. ACAM 257]
MKGPSPGRRALRASPPAPPRRPARRPSRPAPPRLPPVVSLRTTHCSRAGSSGRGRVARHPPSTRNTRPRRSSRSESA